jgi:C4-dicarboxylate-specific signal transduction histidine kinase
MITVHDVTERAQAQQLLKKRVREKTDHLSRINVRLRQEVSERRKVQNELVQAGKLAALGQLSAGIAHEMNQPLSAMRYYLHNAKKLLEKGAVDIHEKNLEKVGELIERMAKMISHLKTFARWRTNKLKAVDALAALDRALVLLAVKIENNGVDISRKTDVDKTTVYADSIRLEQVFVNVISNAIDAVTGNEPGERQVIIELTETDDTIVTGVIDNGSGIKPENLEAVFDPFFTTKEVGKGLGLGLSISFNIIKGFGGSIVASQEENGLTRFSISLQKAKG